jgi:thiol-disulfide isomerase/thioredoxin
MTERLLFVTAVLATASLAWWWWSHRQGAVRAVKDPVVIPSSTLGAKRGYHATFVQFSTPLCAKCPPTARLLQRIANEQDKVAHIEIDASERLDLAREFNVMRTPTILVLDGDGAIVARISGAPNEQQARAALATIPPPPSTEYLI